MDEEAIGEIERALSTLVHRASAPRVEGRLTSGTGFRLERAAYLVLRAIGDHDGIRLKDLSSELGLDVSTVSRHAQHLSEAGLISRDPDPDDRRSAMVQLTTTGREVLDWCRSARRAAIEQILRDWSATDRKDLSVLLQRLVEGVVRYADRPPS